jgi:hypothetical protein
LSYSNDAADYDSTGRTSFQARVIKDLPMMRELTTSLAIDEGRDDRRIDWYTLFKVSRNWQTGNFSSRQLQTLQMRGRDIDSADTIAGPSKISKTNDVQQQSYTFPKTLIDSTSSHIFASMHSQYESIDNAPILLVFPSSCRDDLSEVDRSQEALARYQAPAPRHKQLRITSLAVDKGPMEGDGVRLFVSYSSGNSTLLYYNTASNTFYDELHLEKGSSDCIVSSAMHSNLLVTCTIDFRIRLYHINTDSPRLIEERRSYCCHWPASLRLEPIDSNAINSQYRLSIAYSSPVYPIGWTVGLQEIIVGTGLSTISQSASARRSHVITRLDSPSKEDKRKVLTGLNPSLQERRNQVGRLTSLSYEHPFIVVGTKDNNVVCFRVAGSIRSGSFSANRHGVLELSHVCTFQGHTGTVHSVSLNEGRCVTGGSDGSVRVWRLGDEEAAVAKAAGLLTTIDASLRRGLGKVVTIGASMTSGKRKREARESQHSVPLSLSDILREAQQSNGSTTIATSSSAVVRLVTSAFDHIISVSAIKTSARKVISPNGCRAEHSVEREEEQIQIWNFA